MKGQIREFVGFGGGFTFSLVVLLTEMLMFFSINVFTPVAVNALQTLPQAPNSPSPAAIFGLVALFFVIFDLAQNFLAGYFGGISFGAGFFSGEIIILWFLGPILNGGITLGMIIALLVLFLGVAVKERRHH